MSTVYSGRESERESVCVCVPVSCDAGPNMTLLGSGGEREQGHITSLGSRPTVFSRVIVYVLQIFAVLIMRG